MERLIDLVKQGGALESVDGCDVYVLHQDASDTEEINTHRPAARLAFRIAENLRDAGLEVLLHCGGGSFKAQMKKADASGAEFAVIIGDDELKNGQATVKKLRGQPLQERISEQSLKQYFIDKLASEQD